MSIPGVVLSTNIPDAPPVVSVAGKEKDGKSSLATTLFDWPKQGDRPLVIAIDRGGPNSCSRLGKPVHKLIVDDQPGAQLSGRLRASMSLLEKHFKRGQKPPYTSIVFDDGSSMTLRLFFEVARFSKNPNKLSHFGDAKEIADEMFLRAKDLGVPIIWLFWLKDASVVTTGSADSKLVKTDPGGISTWGNFRESAGGASDVIAILERYPVRAGTPGADSDGSMRLLHTRPWRGMRANSRYALPEPMPANLGWMLHYITTGTGDETSALVEPTEAPQYVPAQPPLPPEPLSS